MKNTYILLLFFPIVLFSQSSDQNYVLTRQYKQETQTSNHSFDPQEVKVNVVYYDGLGRPIQQVANKQANNGKDVVTHIEYDEFGRQLKTFLPFVRDRDDAGFESDALNLTLSYYNTGYYENTANPYSQKFLEPSPLNRVHKQSAPGTSWLGNETNDDDHSIKFDYDLNSENEVKLFKSSVSWNSSLGKYDTTLKSDGYYKPSALYKIVTKDENWKETDGYNNTTTEFKDNLGRVVLKRNYNNGEPHDIYYVYDEIGKLNFVIPPLASDSIVTIQSHQEPYTYSLNFDVSAILVNATGGAVVGGGGVSLNIQNNAVSLTFNGGWSGNAYFNLTQTYSINAIYPLPDMNLGAIHCYCSLDNKYGAVIENNRLRFVDLTPSDPPMAMAGSFNGAFLNPQSISGNQFMYQTVYTSQINNDVIDGLCFQYLYDGKGRLVEKKLPGRQREYIAYNSQDMPVATGPVKSPWGEDRWGWLITKYDVFGRVVYTGWVQIENLAHCNDERLHFETNLISNWFESYSEEHMIDNIYTNYTNNTYPNDFKILTISYYDNYSYVYAPPFLPEVEGQTVLTNVKSLATANWTRVLNGPSNTNGELTFTLYDTKGRSIRTHKTNYLGGYTTVDSKLDFVGKSIYTLTYHKRDETSSEIKVRDTYEYTPQDRLLNHKQFINGSDGELIAKNDYDDLGQLISKRVGSKDASDNVGLQKVDYSYNIRGWLKNINDVDNLEQPDDPTDLFAFKINYNTVENEVSGQVKALYNGNISETFWRSNTDNVLRKYGYQYDNLNRLTNSFYQKPNRTVPITNMYNEQMDYDKNGNIQTMQRNGDYDSDYYGAIQIDNLSYVYDADIKNQLLKVTDATNSPKGFRDDIDCTTDICDDYTYDDNGNMIADQNKNISSILYNHLNLPTQINFGTGDKIEYLYDATGQKKSKKVTEAANETITDYLDGYQYTNTILNFFPHEEGYVNVTYCPTCQTEYQNRFNYVYHYKDHLGNIRLSYGYDERDDVIKIVEENHYYPFGLKHTKYNSGKTKYGPDEEFPELMKLRQIPAGEQVLNKYKYNGKEYQDELGLNMYDYGARNYDPALGRWMNMDPLAEMSRRWSPYSYAYNNPMRFTDPDGMLPVNNVDNEEEKVSDKQLEREAEEMEKLQSEINEGFQEYLESEKEKNKNKKKNSNSKSEKKNSVINWFDGVAGSLYDFANSDETNIKGVLIIYTHGARDYIDGPDGSIGTPEQLDEILKKISPEWRTFRENGGDFTLVLKACDAGRKGGFAQKMSDYVNGLTVIGATSSYQTNGFLWKSWENGVQNNGTWNAYYDNSLIKKFKGN